MIIHVVTQGECLISLGRRYGFTDWSTIWDHTANADLRRARRNPQTLMPGDLVRIPSRGRKAEHCAAGAHNRYRLVRETAMLRLTVEDRLGRRASGKRYELQLGGRIYPGVTDCDGLIEREISADLQHGTLRIWVDDGVDAGSSAGDPWVLQLRIGYLDPVEEVSGVQGRLANLGFGPGNIDGSRGAQTRHALKAFQSAEGLEPTGEIDDRTLDRLRQCYDGI